MQPCTQRQLCPVCSAEHVLSQQREKEQQGKVYAFQQSINNHSTINHNWGLLRQQLKACDVCLQMLLQMFLQ